MFYQIFAKTLKIFQRFWKKSRNCLENLFKMYMFHWFFQERWKFLVFAKINSTLRMYKDNIGSAKAEHGTFYHPKWEKEFLLKNDGTNISAGSIFARYFPQIVKNSIFLLNLCKNLQNLFKIYQLFVFFVQTRENLTLAMYPFLKLCLNNGFLANSLSISLNVSKISTSTTSNLSFSPKPSKN